MATETGEAESPMAMTLKVYEVNREGSVRVLREETEVVPLERPENSHGFPACQCPQCEQPKPVR